jgi:Uma2 family endonuclease
MTDTLQPPTTTSAPDAATSAAATTADSAWPEGIPKRMTLEEYLAWDFEEVRAEWVDGEVVIVSPVRLEHQFLIQFIYELIAVFVRQHNLGRVLLGPARMRLPGRPSGREPDLMFIKTDNLGRLKDTVVDGPADLVVEIVSPESETRDRAIKFMEYEAEGIPEYWLVDPLRQEVVFNLSGEDGRYHPAPVDADGIYHSKVLEGFRLRVSWLWRSPLPSPEEARADLPA